EPGARCSVVGSIALALIALYGLLSPPISLIGRSCTSLNPISAAQSINSRKTETSPIPRSFSLRNPNNGARIPAIFFSGDNSINPFQPQINTDETQIQKMNRLNSTFVR